MKNDDPKQDRVHKRSERSSELKRKPQSAYVHEKNECREGRKASINAL